MEETPKFSVHKQYDSVKNRKLMPFDSEEESEDEEEDYYQKDASDNEENSFENTTDSQMYPITIHSKIVFIPRTRGITAKSQEILDSAKVSFFTFYYILNSQI
jgi:hypothetical protein